MSRRPSARRGGFAGAAPVFAALGDETRLRLVARLCTHGPLPIAGLAAGSPVTRQAVTKHVHARAAAGPARRRPGRGRGRVWELEPRRLAEAREWLDRISRQ